MNRGYKTVKRAVFGCVVSVALAAVLIFPMRAECGSFDKVKKDFGNFLPVWNTQAQWSTPAQQPAAKATSQAAFPISKSPIRSQVFSAPAKKSTPAPQPAAKPAAKAASQTAFPASKSPIKSQVFSAPAKKSTPVQQPAAKATVKAATQSAHQTSRPAIQNVQSSFAKASAPQNRSQSVGAQVSPVVCTLTNSGLPVTSATSWSGNTFRSINIPWQTSRGQTNATVPNITDTTVNLIDGPLLLAPLQMNHNNYNVTIHNENSTFTSAQVTTIQGVTAAMPAKDRPAQVRCANTNDYAGTSNAGGFQLPGYDVISLTDKISNYSPREFVQTALHESGHRRDTLNGTNEGVSVPWFAMAVEGTSYNFYDTTQDPKFSRLNAASTNRGDYVSGFAMTQKKQDFAESYADYYCGPPDENGNTKPSGGTRDFQDLAVKNNSPVLMGKFEYMVNEQTHTSQIAGHENQTCTYVYTVDQKNITRQEVGLTKATVGDQTFTVPDYLDVYDTKVFAIS